MPRRGRKEFFNISANVSASSEVFLERSGRKIWVRGEPSNFPFIPCYTRVRSDSDESAASPCVCERAVKSNPSFLHHSVIFHIFLIQNRCVPCVFFYIHQYPRK